MQKINFQNENIPMIGVGTWCIGDDKNKEEQEIECIKAAIKDYGMALIDTAEMYGDGKSEAIVGKVLEQVNRKDVYIVDKIFPYNAKKGKVRAHVMKSLELTKAGYFDLYLLHWREDAVLQDVVDEMEQLVEDGLIRHWGVSNFDVDDMEDLFACKNGNHCYANQFLYNVSARGVEYDLIPWCKEHNVLPMIYSPLGDTRQAQLAIAKNTEIQQICEKKQISVTNLMLRFVVRNKDLVTVFKTSSLAHLKENMDGVETGFTQEEMDLINQCFPAPTHKVMLEKI